MVVEPIGSVSDVECFTFETDISSYHHHRYRYTILHGTTAQCHEQERGLFHRTHRKVKLNSALV